MTIDRAGGSQTVGMVARPIRHMTDLNTFGQLSERVRTWTHHGLSAAGIGERLNEADYCPARSLAFGAQAVQTSSGWLQQKKEMPHVPL